MNCDGLACWYILLERAGFGRALEHRRTAFLDQVTTARRVLVLGDGDGRFLAAFLRVNRSAEVDSVDSSAAVRWQPPAVSYDLIVTHFFLDCFTDAELRPLVARLAAFATPDARWLVSDFRQPARGPAAWHARAWIGGLYAFFRVATGLRVRRLPNHAAALAAAGFRLEGETLARWGLLTSQLWRRVEPGSFPV